MKNLVLFALLSVPLWSQQIIGPGCTTATMIDRDCDGYGVGSALGPDADDNDATVNTAASMLAKYGTLASFLSTAKGYSPAHIWYLSASAGNDSTCAADDVTKPCRTWATVRGKVVSGDAIVVRAGTIDENANYDLPVSDGTQGSPNIVMSYPGESVTFDHSSATGWYGFQKHPVHDYIIDGIKLSSSGAVGLGMGINLSGSGAVTRVTIRNCEIRDYYDGIWAIAGSNGLVIEDSAIHDNPGEHNIYVGQNLDSIGPILNMVVRRNILYNAIRDNFHSNGVADGAVLESNVMYSANMGAGGGAGNISLQQGWKNGFVRNNVILFGSAYGFLINDYDDGQPAIKPYDQNYNLIVNNTFVHTGRDASGQNLSASGFTAVAVINDSAQSTPRLDLGHNTYRNNIFVEMATGGSGNGVVRYGLHDAGDLDWLSTDAWENNIIYASNGAVPLWDGVGLGTARDWAYFTAHAAAFTGNSQANPQLTAANAAWYNAAGNFNLSPQAGSPAINAGTATGAPNADIRGSARVGLPDIGAYEYQGGSGTVPAAIKGTFRGKVLGQN